MPEPNAMVYPGNAAGRGYAGSTAHRQDLRNPTGSGPRAIPVAPLRTQSLIARLSRDFVTPSPRACEIPGATHSGTRTKPPAPLPAGRFGHELSPCDGPLGCEVNW